jgi:hypothetical protein
MASILPYWGWPAPGAFPGAAPGAFPGALPGASSFEIFSDSAMLLDGKTLSAATAKV